MGDEDHEYSFEKPAWAKKNPLKKTQKGAAVKEGANLSTEITMINASKEELDAKKIGFEKPGWTKDAGLNKDEEKDIMSGANLAVPVTNIGDVAEEKGIGWEKPSWAKNAGLKKKTEAEERGIGWEKPSWAANAGLKKTAKGDKLKNTGNLQAPITQAPHMH